MRTNFYIDGFNLYYGCLKGTPYRWLDVVALCKRLSPQHAVNRIRYFTARVTTPQGWDPSTEQRQIVYLRALATLPIEIHLGHYQAIPKRARLHPFPTTGKKYAMVMKPEEKGSDVNLASYLLLDGFRKDYEQAVVISNDSDLAEPIRLVRDELRLPIGVAFPCSNPKRSKSIHLQQVLTFQRDVRPPALAASQFPNQLNDAQGVISKPTPW